MAYAEGVVMWHVYGGSGWQDCSRQCMWLELHNGFTCCSLMNNSYTECVEMAGYTRRVER